MDYEIARRFAEHWLKAWNSRDLEAVLLGEVREASRQAYRKVIAHLAQAGAEGVILGCTEIELLVGPGDSPIPVFPTTRLHVEAAVDQAIVPSPR
jgi:aspartate racemase